MRILMFFHGGSLNRGCEAIVRSGVKLIKDENPSAKVFLASNQPETDVQIPLLDGVFLDEIRKLQKFTWSWFVSVFRNKILKDENYAFRLIHKDLIDRISDFDLFLSIGGDNYCYGEQPGIYEVDRCIKKAGKKLVLWGASIGTEDLSPEKIEDLKNFDLILARESLTLKALNNQGLKNVRLCADGAFTMEKEDLPFPEGWQTGNTLGFNYSPLVYKKNKNSREAAVDLIKHIIETTSMTIVFTPHVVLPDNDDYECLSEFYTLFKSTGRVILLPNKLNAIQYKGYISKMRFFIGARTHATIAAYSSSVPTMVLGYSIKSKGIALDIFEEEKLVLNLSELSDSDKLISKFNEMLNEEHTIKTKLENRIPEIKKMSQKAASYLFE